MSEKNKAIADLHTAAGKAHEEAANAAARSRGFSDEQRALEDEQAAMAEACELRMSALAQEASAQVAEATRHSPLSFDLEAAEAAQEAADAPMTGDRHRDDGEKASRKAAVAHHRAASVYRDQRMAHNMEEAKPGPLDDHDDPLLTLAGLTARVAQVENEELRLALQVVLKHILAPDCPSEGAHNEICWSVDEDNVEGTGITIGVYQF